MNALVAVLWDWLDLAGTTRNNGECFEEKMPSKSSRTKENKLAERSH